MARRKHGIDVFMDGAGFTGSGLRHLHLSDDEHYPIAEVSAPEDTPLARMVEAMEWAMEARKVMEPGEMVESDEGFATLEDTIGLPCPIRRPA